MREDIKETRLDNGLVILTDSMPDVRSVTLGFFFRKGSRDEPLELNGISHFIEHSVFKGTGKRSAFEIAAETDRLGGNLEAFTTHEETGFALKCVDDKLDEAFDLMADMLIDPTFDPKDLKNEQKVIIEEIKMTDDSPEEKLGDLFTEAFFAGHPLSLPIAGTPKKLKTFDRAKTEGYFRSTFTSSQLVIAAAGNIEHKTLVKLSKKHFSADAPKQKTRSGKPKYSAPIIVKNNPNLEQAHVIIASPFPSARDKERYAADLLANIIGGGTSSRLWQKIREEKGLAYSVGSSAVMYKDCGFFSVFAGTSPKQVGDVLDITISELRQIVNDGVSQQELDLVKEQTISSILLGLEDSAGRAATLAHSEILHGRQIPIEETLANIDAVTVKDIKRIAAKFFKTEKMAFAALGDLKGLKITRDRIAI